MFSKSKTERGFGILSFKDRYGHSCSLQKSSIATEDCIWLGIDNPEPKILASIASIYGVETNKTTGWIDYPVPDSVLITTRMPLNRKQSFKLALKLLSFWLKGDV